MSATSFPEPRIVATSEGPVQVAEVGDGSPVIALHGTPGGFDQASLMTRFLPGDAFRAILPSRPGYLGTDLGAHRTIDRQVDLIVALLDVLDVERVGVLAWSGGGPAAYRLAARHPERVAGLVVLAGVSKALARAKEGMAERFMFHTTAGDWTLRMLAERAPEALISSTLASEGDLSKQQVKERTDQVFADEAQRRFVLDLDQTIAEHGSRRAGCQNDYAQFVAIEDLELERIAVPALIVHGDADTDVAYDHGQSAAQRIPGAELATLPNGTHLDFYLHPDAVSARARATEFLRGAG